MRTGYVIPTNPARLSRDSGDIHLIAAAQGSKWAKSSAARRKSKAEAERNADNRVKFTPDTQPRDTDGKFRRILARLKLNLGDAATEDLAKQIESTEVAQVAGDYEEMRKHSSDLIQMIDSIQDGDLPKGVTNNLREGAQDLGKVLAYLPLPQGDANEKVRFSDLPPASADLVRSMVRRVKDQLDPETAEKYIAVLEGFMSGARTMSSDEMASNLNKLLRVLA